MGLTMGHRVFLTAKSMMPVCIIILEKCVNLHFKYTSEKCVKRSKTYL